MSDDTRTPAENEPAPLVEPTAPEVDVAPAAAEPVPVTADPAEVPVEHPDEPTVPAEPAVAEPAVAAPVAEQPHRVVYVETPVPPRVRGNRVVGVLLALVGAVVFAALYAVVSAFLYFFSDADLFGPKFGQFVASAAFWVPIAVFAVGFILLVLIVNRAGWAAHVFGSLLVAVVVYLGSVGLLLLIAPSLKFATVALVPQIIASAVVAREVAIWLGLAIAARGRRVRVRNTEARAQYDRDVAEQRAQYERPATTVQAP
jgi:hypothetical protein